MLIINPGSTHYDVATGLAVLSYANFVTPGTATGTLGNDPAKVTSNE
jgi:hypothetical protein